MTASPQPMPRWLARGLAAALIATSPAAQELHLFARGADGHVRHATAPGRWSRLDAQSIGAPDAASGGFAVRGTDDALWWLPLDGAPQRIDAVLRSAPGAAWHPEAGLAIAAIGSDGAAWLVIRSNGKWGAWESLGGEFPEGAAPDLAWTSAGRLEIAARGTDRMAWRGTRSNGAWSGWSPTGLDLAGDPGVADAGAGSAELLRIGSDLQAHATSPLGGSFPQGTGIDACADGRGGIAAVARGKDGAAWVSRRQGGSWSGWSSWGEVIDGDPTCAFDAVPTDRDSAKDPWSDPRALAAALARWSEPIGPEASKALGAIDGLAGLRLDVPLVEAHVVRPKDAGLVTIESPEIRSADVARAATAPVLDVPAYRAGALAALSGSAGYYLELRQGGESVLSLQQDWARRPADGAAGLGWSGSRRMHVASVSKAITAMAMLRLLEQRGLSLDDRMAGHLPASWTRGPGVERITFRHLLSHLSGLMTPSPFPAGDSSYPAMRAAIAAGSSGTTTYGYQNVNYGLCRVLMPVIAGTLSRDRAFVTLPLVPELSDAIWDAIVVQAYVQQVQAGVLSPAGVTGATIGPVADDALAQRLPPSGRGWESDDPSGLWYMTGTAGWHFTPHELLEVMAAFRRGESIVPPESAQRMLEFGIGVDSSLRTPAGIVATKSGYWEVPSLGCEQAIVSFLPDDMELVVFVNSRLAPSGGSLAATMDALYVASLRPR